MTESLSQSASAIQVYLPVFDRYERPSREPPVPSGGVTIEYARPVYCIKNPRVRQALQQQRVPETE